MRLHRKTTIIGVLTAVGALLVAGGAVNAFAESADAADIRVDYETGTKNSGYEDVKFNECDDCPDAIRAVEFPRTGDYAVQSRLDYGDGMTVGGTRAESHTVEMESSYFDSGDSFYYGFSIYIVSSWETDSREDIVFQWHNWPDQCEDSKFPSAFLTIQPSGQWRLRVNSDDSACSTPESIDKTSFDLAEVTPGRWHDFVFKFDWDHTDDGGIEAWHKTHKDTDWNEVLSTTGANTYNDDPTTHGYLKWGIYKPAWNDGPTDVDSRLIWHDNIAIGPSFEAVDPASAP